LTFDHARRGVFDRAISFGRDRTLAVDRVAQRVDDASEQRLTDRHGDDAAGAPNLHPLLDFGVGAEDDDADVVLFEVERDPQKTVRKLDEFRLLDGLEPVDARDARADLDHRSDLVLVNVALEVRDLALEDTGDFVSVDHAVLLLSG